MLISPIIYIFLAFLIYKLFLKYTNRKVLSMTILIGILIFPFWDLILQKGIKTIFEISGALEPKIYAYPEKDENGRIGGLDLSNVVPWGDYLLEKNTSIKELLLKNYSFSEKSELESLDLSFQYGAYPNFTYKVFNFSYKNNNDIPIFFQIEKSKARYEIIKKSEDRFFGLYNLSEYKIIDKKNNRILAKSNGISFPDNYAYFRENILLLIAGNNSSMFYVGSIGGWGPLIKIFNLKFRAY